MTDELRIFTTDKTGRIIVSAEDEIAITGVINECCCRNNHEALDGYIYTDPGCKIHGLTTYSPTTAGLEEEEDNDERTARKLAIKKQLIAERRMNGKARPPASPKEKVS